MFQPFLEFKEEYIQRLVSLNKKFLVSQTYNRYLDHFTEKQQTGILLTDYDNLGLASMHLKAIRADRYAAIIHLQNEKHRCKLQEMLKAGSLYKVFWSVVNNVNELERRLDGRYSKNIARYIGKNTSWHVGRDENIVVSYQVTYGELYAVINRKNQSMRVKFEEIEKA